MACAAVSLCSIHTGSVQLLHEVRSSLDYSPSTDTASRQISNIPKFTYSRASPSVRWPNLNLSPPSQQQQPPVPRTPPDSGANGDDSDKSGKKPWVRSCRVKKPRKMTKLELIRDKKWRARVQYLTDKILGLKPDQFVADVLDNRLVQMTPTDFCFLVKWVGKSSWRRALEVYEWLNLRHWYSPNARMLAVILSVLGKANQESLAVETFKRSVDTIGDTVQVYNAMMGVYARNGRFSKVRELLDLMRKRGCVPDLVSFNTLINAQTKSSFRVPGMAVELINEVRRSGVKPDIITYNTLISACSRESYLEQAEKVFSDMLEHKCLPDLWTYNAMISVYARCGFPRKAEELFEELDLQGFVADAVSYNSLLYAFAKEGNIDKVKEIHKEMLLMGFGKDEITYNTIIHMYGKQGRHNLALQLYQEMKISGCRKPDAITYAILIDVLGKANMITEAAYLMSEMLDAGLKPTLQTFSALITGYAKAGKICEAEETFDCMLKSGITPDHLAYSVMLDTLSRFNESRKAMLFYSDMLRNGFMPDLGLYEALLQMLAREKKEEDVGKIVEDMKQLCDISYQNIASILVKYNCYDHATNILKFSIAQGIELDHENLLSILNSFETSGKHSEALDVLDYLREHDATGYDPLITEVHIVMLCKAHQVDTALNRYQTSMLSGSTRGGLTLYETLIQCCDENELVYEASQLFSEMRFYGIGPSQDIYRRMVCIYCKMCFPETAHYVLNQAQDSGFLLENSSIYVGIIELYGRLKLWMKAESLVESVIQRYTSVDLVVWNALLEAYAASGCYERAMAVFNVMMKNGPSPSLDTINSLLQALIADGRLDELYVVIQDLQDMGFTIKKSSMLLMLDAFARADNIFEVKKIYNGMKAAGYSPTMHHYRLMIELFCKGKRVQDVEAMVVEMEELGFKPDISIWNALIKLYTNIGNFKRASGIHSRIQQDGLEPDEDTYNSLILMYCSDVRPEEGLSLIREMNKLGLNPKLDTYRTLISVCGKRQLWEEADEVFKELQTTDCELDRHIFHIMMKIYRTSGNYLKAEKLLVLMKERGIKPNIATMHLLMVSYGTSGLPEEAEKVLKDLKEWNEDIDTLPYCSVIDAYLKKKDYDIGIQKLAEMHNDGVQPDHRIWTCFIRAASLSENTSEAIILLNALRDAGFDLPIRFLTEPPESLILEVDQYLEKLEPVEEDAALNFVNSLEDLLWAFELRSTASWLFQLAIKRRIFSLDVFRVSEKDWGADLRRLSPGAALVGLTLWLDHMQDASLEGLPECSKSVVLITGTSSYNAVSLNATLKLTLWEMGSPFLPCKTRTGVLVAKGHSLRMWLKESPFCFDLQLKDAAPLPEKNSMRIIDGCFMRCGLVAAYRDVKERLGDVRAKKFARLALLTDEKRNDVIRKDLEGAREKAEKMKKMGALVEKGRRVKKRRRFRVLREMRRTHREIIEEMNREVPLRR